MIVIDNILVDEQVLNTPFLCDLTACRGACCTMKGGAGAPLLDDEVQMVHDAVLPASKYLATRSLEALAADNPVVGTQGDYTTLCIDDADCVFVFYEQGIAKCAIERAHANGETSFRKPLSCHLFPARVADFGGPYIYYEEIPECRPALAHGRATGVTAFEMLKEPLERAFGEEWYAQAADFVQQQRDNKQGALPQANSGKKSI